MAGNGAQKLRGWRGLGVGFVAVSAFLCLSLILRDFEVPFDTSYRVACAAVSSALVYWLRFDFPGEKWPQRVFWVSLLVNIGVLCSPLVDRPASRGELALFLLPDGFVVLIAMIAHNQALARSVRAQLIATVVVFTAACAALLALVILQSSAST